MPDADARGDDVFADLPASGRVIVIVPTYNERENLPLITGRLLTSVPRVDVLVVDDSSPDGTGTVADDLAASDPRVHVLHRTAKNGLGAAYLAGFAWALERGYDAIVEMDADGSHAPEQLPRLLHAMAHADLVIGSRYVPGGSVVNWPASRQVLSRGANLYTRLALGSGVRDMTAGYRAYRAGVLRRLHLEDVASQGYCFQVDLAWRTIRAGLRVAEVPITFTERQIGSSKMSGSIMTEAFTSIAVWAARHRWAQLRGAVDRRR